MRRIRPVVARLWAKVSGNSAVSECAAEVVELAPAVDRLQAAAIALPDEFDRVLAVQAETTLKTELERVTEGNRRHRSTIAYRLDNAVLAEGTLYYQGGYDVIRGKSSGMLLPSDSDEFAEMQLCTSYVIDRYFGHWLTDGLCLEVLAEQRSLPALTLKRTPWMHERGYRDVCSLEAVRSNNARVGRLWVVDDRGFNDGWMRRIQELRLRARSPIGRNRAKGVMLTRGTLGAHRNLVNSEEVHKALGRLGFEIVYPEIETPRTLGEKLSEIEIAVAVEGSVQHHCWLTMPPGSTFIAIQPPSRFTAFGKTYANAVGINWGYVVADAHPDGFHLPVDRLLRTLDESIRVHGAHS